MIKRSHMTVHIFPSKRVHVDNPSLIKLPSRGQTRVNSMPDEPAELDDVIVVGNRRRSGSTGAFGGGGGGPGESGGIHQQEVSPDEPDPPYQYDPCDTPEKRLEKAADAAAALAAAAIAAAAAAAGEDCLNYRERGCYLFLESDGSVSIGEITEGLPFENGGVGSVGLSYSGRNPGTIIGSVHSHSVGNHLPSTGPAPTNDGDRGHFRGLVNTINAAGGNGANARIYIVAPRTTSAGEPSSNVISVYGESNLDASIADQEPGPEVDPNGQPCPS